MGERMGFGKTAWYCQAFGVVLLAMLLVSGCAGTHVILGPDPGHPGPHDGGYEHHPGHGGGPPPWAPAHGHRAKRYRYYPSAQVYYSMQRDVYFYYSNGEWQVSARLPGRIRVNMGEHVTLEMETNQPYAYHSEVVRHYPPGRAKPKGKARGREKHDW